MERLRRALLVLGACALFLGMALSQSKRDDVPPKLHVEVAERVPAGEAFDLFLAASEPVLYRVNYGELSFEKGAQELTASLLAEPGNKPLEVTATDGAGNRVAFHTVVAALPRLTPELRLPRQVVAGDPATLGVQWSAGGAEVGEIEFFVSGKPLEAIRRSEDAVAISGIPLDAVPGELAVEVLIRDEFDRRYRLDGSLTVVRGDHPPVEQLTLSQSVLSAATPEARALERRTLERVFAAAVSTPFWDQPFRQPITGVDTSGFGSPRRYVVDGPVSYHEGTDLAASAGTPIQAANDGVVVVADFFPIKGGLVVIDHGGGVTSLYFHQSEIEVSVGERVSRGQVIGRVGTTGLSTGPHLHWEVRVAGVPTNPMAWVGKVLP